MSIRFNPRFTFESTKFRALSWTRFLEHLTQLKIYENRREWEDLYYAFIDGSFVRWLVRQNNHDAKQVLKRVRKIKNKDNKYKQQVLKDLYEALMGTAEGDTLEYLLDEIEKEKKILSFKLQKGKNWSIQLTKDVKLEMVWVKEGEFDMGNDDVPRETPRHKVIISTGYWIGKYPVTQEQWNAMKGQKELINNFDNGGRYPVENINWKEAMNFCVLISNQLSDKIIGYHFDLPTEAQWEYAARGGKNGLKNKYQYSGSNNLDEVGWYEKNSKLETHEVGKDVKPNYLGIYDMSGNVWEWCRDFYNDYPKGTITDPRGPKNGTHHVTRGGSWCFSAEHCRSATRGKTLPVYRSGEVGFRLVLVPNEKK